MNTLIHAPDADPNGVVLWPTAHPTILYRITARHWPLITGYNIEGEELSFRVTKAERTTTDDGWVYTVVR